MYEALEELEAFERENELWQREHKAKIYSQKCSKSRKARRKINVIWGEEWGMYLVALALAMFLTTMIF